MRIINAILALTTAVALGSCGEPAGRTGTGADPVTLTAPDAAADSLLGRLATNTADSAVSVELVSPLDPGQDEDTVALAALADGGLDLAVIREGRLEAEGADSLSPLGAPFVVSNNDQAMAIARDPLTADLFASLPDIGLVGLGLEPIGVRRPFGYVDPLLGAEDYAGQTINTRFDATAEAIIAALHATSDHSADQQRTDLVEAGRLRGIEASMQVVGAVDLPAVMTSNVALYERFDVVVVREAMWESLTSDQQQQLRTAVVAARDDADEAARTESELFQEWCSLPGAGSTEASAAQLASLHAVLDPLTAAVAAHHGDVLDRMRSLHDGTHDSTGLTCDPQETDQPDWQKLHARGDQRVLDGVWRIANTEDELAAGGLTPQDAHNNAGVWELDISDGHALVSVPDGNICHWTFVFAGDELLVDLGPDASCQGAIRGTYELEGDEVRFDWAFGDDAVDPDAKYLANLYDALFAKAVRVQDG